MIWTIPNILTMIRIVLVPVMMWVFNKYGALAALCVFAAAGITDVLDGYIARRFNQISNLGKLLDPLADKLMVVATLVMLVIKEYLPAWVAISLACKELGQVIGAGILLKGKDVVVMANKFGKAATATFFAAIALMCLSDLYAPLLTVGRVLSYVALGISFIALISYIRAYLVQGRNDRGEV